MPVSIFKSEQDNATFRQARKVRLVGGMAVVAVVGIGGAGMALSPASDGADGPVVAGPSEQPADPVTPDDPDPATDPTPDPEPAPDPDPPTVTEVEDGLRRVEGTLSSRRIPVNIDSGAGLVSVRILAANPAATATVEVAGESTELRRGSAQLFATVDAGPIRVDVTPTSEATTEFVMEIAYPQ